MSQSIDQDNGGASRVVLLATDRSQSILGEIVDGQTNTLSYSAYGEQSAPQKVETRLGFNGQLREASIGWYLLGNGYRVYNPRLMRFHSPDSWSPFGGGGVECVYVLRGGSGESGGSDGAFLGCHQAFCSGHEIPNTRKTRHCQHQGNRKTKSHVGP